MSQRHQVGTVLPGYNPLKVANAPTIGTATAGGSNCASITFTAPSCVGGAAILSYTAYANCGVSLTSGASSPLVITGLTSGTSYTFKVIATNLYGPSGPSSASSSITARVQGQVLYGTPGTFSWVAPVGVTSISVVAVGGGSLGGGNRYFSMNGGGGGALAYTNNITVIPGNSYSVQVGNGTYTGLPCSSILKSSKFVCNPIAGGGGGNNCSAAAIPTAGTVIAGSGGSGGVGGAGAYNGNAYGIGGGAGGAGGYSGAGGRGSTCAGTCFYSNGTNGSGGGGGGGSQGGNGGGVGVLGEGASGNRGYITINNLQNGFPGSGGCGKSYGGGGGGNGNCGGGGAVRIIWPGTTRSFPSTNTGNL